jgi:ribonuclease P protein component
LPNPWFFQTLEVLSNYSFPRRCRLIKTDDFSSVFNFRKRLCGKFLAMHYCYNSLSWPRLGMVVGKKTARSAVERNYMRRVLREQFRHSQAELKNVDLVVRTQTVFGRNDYPAVVLEFAELLGRLRHQADVQTGTQTKAPAQGVSG